MALERVTFCILVISCYFQTVCSKPEIPGQASKISTGQETRASETANTPHHRVKRIVNTDFEDHAVKRIREFVGKRGRGLVPSYFDLSPHLSRRSISSPTNDALGSFTHFINDGKFIRDYLGKQDYAVGSGDDEDANHYVKRNQDFLEKPDQVRPAGVITVFEDVMPEQKRIREFVGKRSVDYAVDGSVMSGDQFTTPQVKRIREFVGKRNSYDAFPASEPAFDYVISPEVKRIREFVGKRDGSDAFDSGGLANDQRGTLVKRIREFVGKRNARVDKRIREFVGKRGFSSDGLDKIGPDGILVFSYDVNQDVVPEENGFILAGGTPADVIAVKRIREFVGKRSDLPEDFPTDHLWKYSAKFDSSSEPSPDKRIREFVGKRDFSYEPTSVKRIREFVGKRGEVSYPYINKRIREFVGKRNRLLTGIIDGDFLDVEPSTDGRVKRICEFVGKRDMVQPRLGNVSKRIREFVGKRDDLKRGINKRIREFVGKRDYGLPPSKRIRELVGK